MRLTGLVWSCTTCLKDFEVFSDDGANDSSVCWNWCPHCGAKNEIWKRFKHPNESILPGIGHEEAIKCFPKHEKAVAEFAHPKESKKTKYLKLGYTQKSRK